MNGALVIGDIISRWDPAASPIKTVRENPAAYMTDLTFGLKVSGDGLTPSSTGDPDFNMSYWGNISSPSSINVSLKGGTLNYSGTMTVNSFTLASGTTFSTTFYEGQAAVIDAQKEVNLATNSRIAYQPFTFTYGDKLGPSPAAVSFTNAKPATRATLVQSSGNFGIGPYDYSYSGISWNKDNSAVVINITREVYNDSRGGTDAQNSPLPAILRTPGNAAVSARSMRRFPSATRAQVAPTGTNLAPGTGEFGRRGTVARSAGSFSGLASLAAAIPELQWRSVGDGGWEAQDGRSGVWVAPSYGILQHHGDRKYTMNGPGLTFGIDHRMSDNFFLGAALALDFPHIDSDDAEMRAWGTTGILYGGIEFPLGLELGFSGFLGGMHYYRERTYENATHHSEFDSKIVGVAANLGRRFSVLKELVVRPFVSWEFDRVDRGAATENDGEYALHYEAGTSTLHRLQAGADVAWDFGSGSIGGRLFWSGIRGENLDDSRFSFVRDRQGNAFEAPIDGLDRDSLGAALNFSMRPTENTRLTLEYSLLTGPMTTSHLVTAGFRFEF
ncbi:MAG: autotransporter outer membrane beta-barrel domain-containing protein [Desulfovibrio sp.]|nr:autotransporter outer membrane beta-barrel domain-containing protein [Desulfovibrio sp.]